MRSFYIVDMCHPLSCNSLLAGLLTMVFLLEVGTIESRCCCCICKKRKFVSLFLSPAAPALVCSPCLHCGGYHFYFVQIMMKEVFVGCESKMLPSWRSSWRCCLQELQIHTEEDSRTKFKGHLQALFRTSKFIPYSVRSTIADKLFGILEFQDAHQFCMIPPKRQKCLFWSNDSGINGKIIAYIFHSWKQLSEDA